MQTMFRKLKEVLPPKASFQLRALKSDFVDKELRELRRFAKRIGGSKVDAVDVGANFGIYSAALAANFHRVLSLEPNPECVEYLHHVLPANCDVIASAMSNEEGRTVLRIPMVGQSRETTRATISSDNAFQDLDLSSTVEVEVSVQSIDGLAKAGRVVSERLTFIKIDVEGHELAVLQGAKGVLASARPGLCLEIERRHGTRSDEVLALLRNSDYTAVRFHDGRYVADVTLMQAERSAASGHDDIVNVFFMPANRVERLNV